MPNTRDKKESGQGRPSHWLARAGSRSAMWVCVILGVALFLISTLYQAWGSSAQIDVQERMIGETLRAGRLAEESMQAVRLGQESAQEMDELIELTKRSLAAIGRINDLMEESSAQAGLALEQLAITEQKHQELNAANSSNQALLQELNRLTAQTVRQQQQLLDFARYAVQNNYTIISLMSSMARKMSGQP